MKENIPSQGLQNSEIEVSILDIILFIKTFWKTIFLFGLIGILCACIFLWATPSRYEAVTLIQMAKISTPQNPLGINVEEPANLISRMSSSTSLDSAVIAACGLSQLPGAGADLSKAIKLSIPKGLTSVVELKVTRSSGEGAKECAQSIFNQISTSQATMLELKKDSVKARLLILEERLRQDRQLLAKLDNSKSDAVSISYFAILSEKRALEDERDSLILTLSGQGLLGAEMQYPIAVTTKPVYPKKMPSLIMGLMGGMFLGLFIVLSRKIISRLSSELADNRGGHD